MRIRPAHSTPAPALYHRSKGSSYILCKTPLPSKTGGKRSNLIMYNVAMLEVLFCSAVVFNHGNIRGEYKRRRKIMNSPYTARPASHPTNVQLFNDLELLSPLLGKLVFVVVPYSQQLIDILFVHPLHIVFLWVLLLNNTNRPSNDNVQWASVRHHADVVVEDAAGMEQWNRPAHDGLDEKLELVDVRVGMRIELLVKFVLTEADDGHKVSALADS